MRVRCSQVVYLIHSLFLPYYHATYWLYNFHFIICQGIQVQEYYGNFCKRIPTDVDLPGVCIFFLMLDILIFMPIYNYVCMSILMAEWHRDLVAVQIVQTKPTLTYCYMLKHTWDINRSVIWTPKLNLLCDETDWIWALYK